MSLAELVRRLAVLLGVFLAAHAALADVPRQITYQGRLTGGGTGPVDLTVRFYDTGTNGSPLFEETHVGVPRTSGLFTVYIGSNTPGGVSDSALATGTGELWLGVSVNGQTELTPRTQMVMTPFAAKAKSAEQVVLPGSVTPNLWADSSGRIITSGDMCIGSPGFAERLALAGGILRIDNYDSPPFGNFRDDYQILLRPRGTWFTTNIGQPAGPGLNKNAFVVAIDDGSGPRSLLSVHHAGNVGIGTTNPGARLEVRDESNGSVTLLQLNHAGVYQNGDQARLLFCQNSVPLSGIADVYEYPSHHGLALYSADYDVIGERMRITGDGDVGIGTTAPQQRLHVENGGVLVRSPWGTNALSIRDPNGHAQSFLDIDSAGNSSLLLYASGDGVADVYLRSNGDTFFNGGNVGIGTMYPQAKLDVTGTARVGVLDIVGGSDIAEPFDVADAESIKPGMVVCIDPDRPGKLQLSRSAYDRTVAGVVSGANGINAGLTLKQPDTAADGSLPVALTGRVYVWCDADAGGPIQPGDLLTTSDTPGHAMKVTDHAKAQGAILGKAMSRLESEKGLVLVLVTLQ